MPNVFEQAMSIVFAEEAGFTDNPRDNGNWTGGHQGVGELRGSNFGISAASYPTLDIKNISRATAHSIYERDYWLKFACDKLPPPLALLVFDAAVNGGHPIVWLQTAVGTTPDGSCGPATLNAIAAHKGQGTTVCAKFMAQRLLYDTSLASWSTFKGGWSMRLMTLPFLCMTMTGDTP